MKINKKLVKYNFSSRYGTKIEYIVIHDTGNDKPLAHAEARFNYFNSGVKNASAHYFVDEKQILQIIEDENTAWHCGDGKGKYDVTNSNSIGIEICVNKDGNYGMAVQNTVLLTKELMDKHNIPLDKVIRHYDASRKNCPASMSPNNWEGWIAFIIALERELNKVVNEVKVKIKGRVYRMDGVFQGDKNYVSVRELAETLGYTVGWDQAAKVVEIK